jgi:alkylation response protein AidB-like acyl-CoA dehydrogenase
MERKMAVAEIRAGDSSASVHGADQPRSAGTVREQLLASIEALREIVEGSAKDAELERTLPERAWAAMDRANLFSLKAPRELGGLEADPMLQMEAFERMAYFDSSAGWTLMVGAGDQFIAGGWAPEEALDLIFDGRKVRRGALALAPSGKATPVDGGYKLSGRWQFASGIRHAEWVVAGAMLQDTAEFVPFRAFLLPVGDVTIHDNWNVGGLRGTGSNDFSIGDVFVPREHAWIPFAPSVRGGPLFRLGAPEGSAMEHAAFAVGVARRAVDETAELAKTKMRGLVAGRTIGTREHFQWDLGHQDTRLQAARAHAFRTYEAIWNSVSAGDSPTVSQRVAARGAAAYATEVAIDVVHTMFRQAGAKSLYSGNIIERCMRDVTAAGQHLICNNLIYQERGKELLDIDEVSPLF